MSIPPGGRWRDVMRVRFEGPPGARSRLTSRARVQAGGMDARRQLSGLPVARQQATYADGVYIDTRWTGTQMIARIIAPADATEETGVQRALWVPRGFVLYPANEAAPRGWGLPIVQIAHDDAGEHSPYDPINTAPGLDVTRWTPAGPLGQVLLTHDVDAGYPRNSTGEDDATLEALPLLYNPGAGPTLDVDENGEAVYEPPETTESWGAFRLEFEPFLAGGDVGATAFKRDIFERTNEHRVSVGRDPLYLPPRGRFDSAQIAADVMQSAAILGHFSEKFPATYRCPDDRVMHDGMPASQIGFIGHPPDSRNSNTFENAIANAIPPTPVVGTDPNGVTINAIPHPGADITSQQAWEGWLGSPLHRAAIESTFVDSDDGRAGVTLVGVNANYAVQHFLPFEYWIACGNRSWTSRHAEIPPVSWMGFPSLNLAWETLPVDPAGSGPDPFAAIYPFADLYDGAPQSRIGISWDGTTITPALTRCVYMRGRCIAMAPRAGLVWAAAVQKVAPTTGAAFYRLVILSHHPADQPNDAHYGVTAYLRVWWVDLPDIVAFAASPRSFIRGEYGQENEGFPWDDVNSPYSWRGGLLVDVSSSDGVRRDRLKYDAQWVFDSEGRNAACLRAIGTYSDYTQLQPNGLNPYVWRGADTLRDSALLTLALEEGDDGLTAHAQHRSAPTGAAASAPCEIFAASNMSGRVVAVGYDEDDALKFAFKFVAVIPNSTPNFDALNVSRQRYGMFGFNSDYNWRPRCDWFTGPLIKFHDSIRPTTQQEAAGAYGVNCTVRAVVLDVRDEVVLAVGVPPYAQIVQEDHDGAPPTFTAIKNPQYVTCWRGTATEFVSVRVWRKGTLLGERKFANPDDAVPNGDPDQICYATAGGTQYVGALDLPWNANMLAQASYVRLGDDWILSYSMVPQPFASWVNPLASPPSPCGGGESCRPLVTQIFTRRPTAGVPRGGYSYSSIGTHGELAALTQTPGARPRFLYTRVV